MGFWQRLKIHSFIKPQSASLCKTLFHFSKELEAPFSALEKNVFKQNGWFYSNSTNALQSSNNVVANLQNNGLSLKLVSECKPKLLTAENNFALFDQNRGFHSSMVALSDDGCNPKACKKPPKKKQGSCLGEKKPPKIPPKPKEKKTVWCKSAKRVCKPPCKPTCERIMMPSCEEPYREVCYEEEVEPPCEKILPPTPSYSECLCTAPPRYLGCPECFPKFPSCPKAPAPDLTCFPAKKKIKMACKRRPMPEQKAWEDDPKCKKPPQCILSERSDNIFPGKVWRPLRNYFPEHSRSYGKYSPPIEEKRKCIDKEIVPMQCSDTCYTEDECIAAMRQQTEGKLEIKKSTTQTGSCSKFKSKIIKPKSRKKREFSTWTPFGLVISRSYAACGSLLDPVPPLPHKPFHEKTIKDIRAQTEGDCRTHGKCLKITTMLEHCHMPYRAFCEDQQIYIPCQKRKAPYPSYSECKDPDFDKNLNECLYCPHSITKRIIYRKEVCRNCYSTQTTDLAKNEMQQLMPRKYKFLSISPTVLGKPSMLQVRNYSNDELQPKYEFIKGKPPFNAVTALKIDPSLPEKCLARRCKMLQTPYLGDDQCPETPDCDTPENRAKYCKETIKHTLTCNDKITFKYPPQCTDKSKKKFSTLTTLSFEKIPNQYNTIRHFSYKYDRNPRMTFNMPSTPKAVNITPEATATGFSGMFKTFVNFFKARPNCGSPLTSECQEKYGNSIQVDAFDSCVKAKPSTACITSPPPCRLQSTSAGEKDDKKKKCMKICCPGCKGPEDRPNCIEDGVAPPCIPKPTPYPSFYESGRFEFARKPINECTLVEDLYWAKMIEESYMKLPKKKEAAKDKACPPDPCSSQKRTFTCCVKNIATDLFNFTKPLSYKIPSQNLLERNLTWTSSISTTSALRDDEKHPFELGEECKEKQKFEKPNLNMAKTPAEPCTPYEKPRDPPPKIVKCPPPKKKEKPPPRCKMPHGPPEILIDPYKRYKECCELPPPPTIKPCEDDNQNTRNYSTVAINVPSKKEKNIFKKSNEEELQTKPPLIISRTVKWGELNEKGQKIFKEN